MDEYLTALKKAWTGEAFDFEGTGYSARGNRIQPRPIQHPHPPLYIGGNSKRAIRRVVELGDGWNPFITGPQISSTARTAAMANADDLVTGIAYMREHCEKIGRKDTPQIFLEGLRAPDEESSPQQLIDMISQYKEMGVTGVAVPLDGRTRAEWCDHAEQFGADVISKIRND